MVRSRVRGVREPVRRRGFRGWGGGLPAAVGASGLGALAVGGSGWPEGSGAVVVVVGGVVLLVSLLRGGRGAVAVALLAVAASALGALLPGGSLGPVRALCAALTLLAFAVSLQAYGAGTWRAVHGRHLAASAAVAAGAAALCAVPTAGAVWLLPAGPAAAVAAFATATATRGGR